MPEPALDLQPAQFAHPTIRLAGVLALVVFVPQFGLLTLLMLGALLLIQRAAVGRRAFDLALQSVWRLRWLLLAIAVLYLGFTPGQPLLPFSDVPSVQGVTEGGRRVLVLVVILLAVQAVLQALGPRQLAAAITQLASPLQWVGLPVERFAVRLAAALDAVQGVGDRARAARDDTAAGSALQRAARLIVDVESAARAAADELADVPRLPTPAVWAWLLPVAIAAASYGLSRLVW